MANLAALSPFNSTSECTALPSSNAAADFLQGVDGAGWRVLTSTLGRAALISTGLYASGIRNPRDLAKHSIAAAAAIEVFVLYWVKQELNAAKKSGA